MSKQVRIYNRIKAAIAENQKTSKWLAEEIGVSRESVSKWCRNISQPEIENLFKIADALEVDPGDLLVRRQDSVPVKRNDKVKSKKNAARK